MADHHTSSAVAAAVEVAAAHDLPANRPQVLHERSNVLVRLGPVVARVPGTTRLARPDPGPWLARDVAVSRHLTQRGVPVVSPTTDPPAGPHFAAGLPVTLWHYTPHDPDHRYPPDVVAESLARVHEALRGYPGELSSRGPLDDVDRVLTRYPESFGDFLPRLRAENARLAAALPANDVQALHGDAHPRNVMATEAGPCWFDFEDTWRGPLAHDLATLAVHGAPEYLAAYPGEVDEGALQVCSDLRRLLGLIWQFVIAKRFPDRLDGARAALEGYFS